MTITPNPMDPERLAQLRAYVADDRSWMDDSAHTLAELLADRDWHRARVEVTDEDILAAGLGNPGVCEDSPRLRAWSSAQPNVHYVDGSNDDPDHPQGRLRHGFWTGDMRVEPAVLIIEASPMAHEEIINELAIAVGRAPLDVLDEIAAMEVEVAELPILFSGPLVRAILAGRKTETRRLVTKGTSRVSDIAGEKASWATLDDASKAGESVLLVGKTISSQRFIDCRVQPRDRLWVRETHGVVPVSLAGPFDPVTGEGCKAIYRATDGDPDPEVWENWKWRPSIFMRKWASRITLRVTEVRAERLQEITNDGAIAEGLARRPMLEQIQAFPQGTAERRAFRQLWDEINGNRPGANWDANPWCWVYKFEVER